MGKKGRNLNFESVLKERIFAILKTCFKKVFFCSKIMLVFHFKNTFSKLFTHIRRYSMPSHTTSKHPFSSHLKHTHLNTTRQCIGECLQRRHRLLQVWVGSWLLKWGTVKVATFLKLRWNATSVHRVCNVCLNSTHRSSSWSIGHKESELSGVFGLIACWKIKEGIEIKLVKISKKLQLHPPQKVSKKLTSNKLAKRCKRANKTNGFWRKRRISFGCNNFSCWIRA